MHTFPFRSTFLLLSAFMADSMSSIRPFKSHAGRFPFEPAGGLLADVALLAAPPAPAKITKNINNSNFAKSSIYED